MKPYYQDSHIAVYNKSCTDMSELHDESVQMVVTSPPYWGLRKYAGNQDLVWGGTNHHEHIFGDFLKGHSYGRNDTNDPTSTNFGGWANWNGDFGKTAGQFCQVCNAWRGSYGLEPTPELYISHSIEILKEIKRVLRKDGVVFWNVDDSYFGSSQGWGDTKTNNKNNTGSRERQKPLWDSQTLKPKDLCLIPFRFAIAAQEAGWWVRSVIIWNKPNPMPESVGGSYLTRHYVTIEEYERLQSLRITQSGNQNRTSDLPGMSQIEISGCQTPLSTESKGNYNGESEGTETRCERKAQACEYIPPGEIKQGKIRGNREGEINPQEGDSPLFSQTRKQNQTENQGCQTQTQSELETTKETSRQALSANKQGKGVSCEIHSETQVNSRTSREYSETCGMAGDSESQSLPLPLLQEEIEINNRSCDSPQQRRLTRQGKHSSGLPIMQFNQIGQDNQTLIECPGCPQCAEYGGYILHNVAGRPTSAHEYIFLLTKSANYYWDQEAVLEPIAEASRSRLEQDIDNQIGSDRVPGKTNGNMKAVCRKMQDVDKNIGGSGSGFKGHSGNYDADGNLLGNPLGRNLRDVWTFPTQSYKEAHFATFPEELPERCIKAGSKEGDVILDPFSGSGTTLWVAKKLNRKAVGYELSSEYCELIIKRNSQQVLC